MADFHAFQETLEKTLEKEKHHTGAHHGLTSLTTPCNRRWQHGGTRLWRSACHGPCGRLPVRHHCKAGGCIQRHAGILDLSGACVCVKRVAIQSSTFSAETPLDISPGIVVRTRLAVVEPMHDTSLVQAHTIKGNCREKVRSYRHTKSGNTQEVTLEVWARNMTRPFWLAPTKSPFFCLVLVLFEPQQSTILHPHSPTIIS